MRGAPGVWTTHRVVATLFGLRRAAARRSVGCRLATAWDGRIAERHRLERCESG